MSIRDEWQARYGTNMTDRERTAACTATHPNHEMTGWIGAGETPLFWQAWCSICEANGEGRSEIPNNAMSPEYLAECKARTRAEFESRPKRGMRKPTRVCPHCGGELP